MARTRWASRLFAVAVAAAIVVAVSSAPAVAAGDRSGDLDPSFGSGGSAVTHITSPPNGLDSPGGAVIQPDGKIVQVGATTSYGPPSSQDFVVVRLNPDGSPDQGFGVDGKVVTDIGTPSDAATAVALQPDGKIVVAGQDQAVSGGPEDLVVARYDSSGELDPSFGLGGITTVSDPGLADAGYAIAVDAGGNIVVAGVQGDLRTHNDPLVVRLDSSGLLDPSFGSSGETVVNFRGAPENTSAYAMEIQPDGRIVIGGTTTAWSGDDPSESGLARLTSGGALDPTFGSDGIVATSFPNSRGDTLSGLALQPDGRIVAVGGTQSGTTSQSFGVVRYLSDGELDPSFGSGGFVSAGSSSVYGDNATSLAIQADGRIVVGGYGGPTTDLEVLRLESDGSPDPTFGSNGLAQHSIDGVSDFPTATALDADGNIVVTANIASAFASVRLLGAPPPSAYVSRAGTALQSEGQPFRPVGLNIYNANSVNDNCWYSMDGSVLDDSLTAIGPGKNTMRAWFFQNLATRNGVRDWAAFDRTLATARAHGYRVIVTLGNQWQDCDTGYGFKNTTWYQSGYKQPDPAGTVSYRDWVQEVAARYEDDPTILAWQLLNEPEVQDVINGSCADEATSTALLKSFATDISGAIKAVDAHHLISLGTIGSGQCGAQGDDFASVMSVPTLDLCEFHDYDTTTLVPGDQFNGLQRRLDQCNALGKPLLVGELGVRPSDVGGTLQDRADEVASKLCAQLTAGVAGVLVWAWDKDGSRPNDYDIGPSDPVLSALAPWSDPSHTCAPPDAPHGIIAAAGSGTASVSWLPPSAEGGSPVTAYTVTPSPDGSAVTVPASVSSALFTGLTNGQSYTFTVTATNAAGTGPSSSATSAVTPQAGAPAPVTVAQTLPDAGTVTTDPSNGGPSPGNPITSTVTTTSGGDVEIAEGALTTSPPSGFTLLGEQVTIEAPDGTAAQPLQLVFTLDPSLLQGGGATSVTVFRTEGAGSPTPVPACGGSPGTASPDPCLASISTLGSGAAQYTVLSSSASVWNFGVVGEPVVMINSVSSNLVGAGGSTKVTWHADENGAFGVRVGGTSCTTGSVVSSGNYTTAPATKTTTVNASALAEGTNTIRVCVTDAATSTNSATVQVTKDTTVPVVVIDGASPGLLGPADASTTVTWHANENGTFTVRVGGAGCGGGTQVGSGSYSTAPTTTTTTVAASSLASGANTIRVCVTDAAANPGSATTTVAKDTTPPTVTIAGVSDALLGQSDPSTTVNWHANENGTFSVRVGGTGCGDGAQAAAGTYSGSPATNATTINAGLLAEGANTVRVCVTDAAGNTGSKTTIITRDTTSPTVTVDGASTNVVGSGGSTKVTWHGSENGTFSVRVGGVGCGDGTSVSSGSYTGAPGTHATTVNATSLADGPNVIRVCVVDAAGNPGAATVVVTKDTTPPMVIVDGVSTNPLGAADTATTITWHANEDGAFSVRVGGSSCTTGTKVSSGTYSTAPTTTAATVNASSLVAGANTIRICVTDAAANPGATTTTVTKDTTPPTVTVNGIAPAIIGSGQSATLTWHANENGSFSVRVGGTDCVTGAQVASGNYGAQPATTTATIPGSTLASGSNTIRVCVTDAAGNTGSKTTTLKLDVTAPTVTVARPTSGAAYTRNQSVKASYSCKDESGGSGLATCTGTVATGSAMDTSTPGAKTFVVTATDQVGNQTTLTISYTVK